MYPSYPHNPHEQTVETCARAIEGDQYHLRIQRGQVASMGLTGGSTVSHAVTFDKPFTSNTTPTVCLTLNSMGTISSKLNIVASSVTNTGFTLQAYTDTTQQITVSWLAIGKAE